ncbi:uncharacterized protein LOC144151807 [Haemaphysalis longicornis]
MRTASAGWEGTASARGPHNREDFGRLHDSPKQERGQAARRFVGAAVAHAARAEQRGLTASSTWCPCGSRLELSPGRRPWPTSAYCAARAKCVLPAFFLAVPGLALSAATASSSVRRASLVAHIRGLSPPCSRRGWRPAARPAGFPPLVACCMHKQRAVLMWFRTDARRRKGSASLSQRTSSSTSSRLAATCRDVVKTLQMERISRQL